MGWKFISKHNITQLCGKKSLVYLSLALRQLGYSAPSDPEKDKLKQKNGWIILTFIITVANWCHLWLPPTLGLRWLFIMKQWVTDYILNTSLLHSDWISWSDRQMFENWAPLIMYLRWRKHPCTVCITNSCRFSLKMCGKSCYLFKEWLLKLPKSKECQAPKLSH